LPPAPWLFRCLGQYLVDIARISEEFAHFSRDGRKLGDRYVGEGLLEGREIFPGEFCLRILDGYILSAA